MDEKETNRVRLSYARTGAAAWLAHLDMVRLFSRALNRAAWPLAWSEDAFNPRPDLVFALPAGCGIELEADPVEVGLSTPPGAPPFDLQDALDRLNASLPPGVAVRGACFAEAGGQSLMARVFAATYRVEAPGVSRAYRKTFTGAPVTVEHVRKGKATPVELSSRITDADASRDDVLRLTCGAGSVNHLRIDLLLEALVRDGGLAPEDALGARIVREAVLLREGAR